MVEEIPGQMDKFWIRKDIIISRQIPTRLQSRPLQIQLHFCSFPERLSDISGAALNLVFYLVLGAVASGDILVSLEEFFGVIGYAIKAESNSLGEKSLLRYVPKEICSNSTLTTLEWEQRLAAVTASISEDSPEENKLMFVRGLDELGRSPQLRVSLDDSDVKSVLVDRSGIRVWEEIMDPSWDVIDDKDLILYRHQGELITLVRSESGQVKELTLTLLNPEEGVLIHNYLLDFMKKDHYPNLAAEMTWDAPPAHTISSADSLSSEEKSACQMSEPPTQILLSVTFEGSDLQLQVSGETAVEDILKMVAEKLGLEEHWFYCLRCLEGDKLCLFKTISSQVKSSPVKCELMLYCLPHNFYTYCVNADNQLRIYSRLVQLIAHDQLPATPSQLIRLNSLSKRIDKEFSRKTKARDELERKCATLNSLDKNSSILSKNRSKHQSLLAFLYIARSLPNYGLFKFLNVSLNGQPGYTLECDPQIIKLTSGEEEELFYYEDCSDFALSGGITFRHRNQITTIDKNEELLPKIYEVVSTYFAAYQRSLTREPNSASLEVERILAEWNDISEQLQLPPSTTMVGDQTLKRNKKNKLIEAVFSHEDKDYRVSVPRRKAGYQLIIQICKEIGFSSQMFINVLYWCPYNRENVFILKHKQLKKQSISLYPGETPVFLRYYVFPHSISMIPANQMRLCWENLRESLLTRVKVPDSEEIFELIGMDLVISEGFYGGDRSYSPEKYVPLGFGEHKNWGEILPQLHQQMSGLLAGCDETTVISKYVEKALSVEDLNRVHFKIYKYNKVAFDSCAIDVRGIELSNGDTTVTLPMEDIVDAYYNRQQIGGLLKNKTKFVIKYKSVPTRRRAYDYYLHYSSLYNKITSMSPDHPLGETFKFPSRTEDQTDNESNYHEASVQSDEPSVEPPFQSHLFQPEPVEPPFQSHLFQPEPLPAEPPFQSQPEPVEPPFQSHLFQSEPVPAEPATDEIISRLFGQYREINDNLDQFNQTFLQVMRHIDKNTEREIFVLLRSNWKTINRLDAIHRIYHLYFDRGKFTRPESVTLHQQGCHQTSENLRILAELLQKIKTHRKKAVIRLSSSEFSKRRINLPGVQARKEHSIRVIFGGDKSCQEKDEITLQVANHVPDMAIDQISFSTSPRDKKTSDFVTTAVYEF